VPGKPKLNLKCPTCKQPVERASEDLPFCSERCRLIDLGKWASGQYVVSSPVPDISDEAGMQTFPEQDDED
jgi:uncharacterized protein